MLLSLNTAGLLLSVSNRTQHSYMKALLRRPHIGGGSNSIDS